MFHTHTSTSNEATTPIHFLLGADQDLRLMGELVLLFLRKSKRGLVLTQTKNCTLINDYLLRASAHTAMYWSMRDKKHPAYCENSLSGSNRSGWIRRCEK